MIVARLHDGFSLECFRPQEILGPAQVPAAKLGDHLYVRTSPIAAALGEVRNLRPAAALSHSTQMTNRYWTLAERPAAALAGRRHLRAARGADPRAWSRAGADADDLCLARPLSVGLQAPRHRARGRALPCAHRLAGDREPDGRLRARRLRLQHQRLGRVRSDGRGRAAPRLHGPAQARPRAGPHLPGGGRAGYAGADRLCRHDPSVRAQGGETVVVSAASGGVGQIAGQLAKLRGAAWSASPGARRSAAS